MATQVWRGGAKATAQVTHVTPANIEPGDIFTLTINRKAISVTAGEELDAADQPACIASVVSEFLAAVGQYDNDEPEWREVSASAGTDVNGNTTHLILTGPTDGKPFTVSASTTDGAMTVIVTTVQEAQTARNEIQRVTIPTDVSSGNFTLTFAGQTTGNIAYNASTGTVKTALEGLSSIAPALLTVSGVAGSYYDVEFSGSGMAGLNQPLMTMGTSGLTGAAKVTVLESSDYRPGYVWDVEKDDADSTDGWRARIAMTTGEEFVTPFVAHNASEQEVVEAFSEVGLYVDVVYSEPLDVPTWKLHFLLTQYEPNTIAIDSQSDDGTVSLGSAAYSATEGTASQEVQYVILNGTMTITLTLEGETTATIGPSLGAGTGSGTFITELTALTGVVSPPTVTVIVANRVFKVQFNDARDFEAMTGTVVSGSAVIPVVTIQTARAAKNEIQRVVLAGSPTGGTFTLTYSGQTTSGVAYNASAATLQSALEALSNIGSGEALVTGPAGGAWLVEFAGTLAATNVDKMTGSGASLTGASSQTFTASSITTATGPNNFNDANNWYNPASPTSAAMPGSGDTIIFRDNAIDCLYGLDALTGVTVASLVIDASFLGRLGLARHNGEYYEYRQRRLALGATAVKIGSGSGGGSSRVKLDLEAVASTVTVLATGVSEDDTEPLTITGTHASNIIRIQTGRVGIGTEEAADAPVVATLVMTYDTDIANDAIVRVKGATLTTIQKNGGQLLLESGCTTLTQRAGTLRVDATGTITTLNVDGGTAELISSGTVTNALVYTGAELSLTGNLPGCTITNLTLFGGATFRDPFEKATLSNGIILTKCGVEDVTMELGKDITLVRS